MIFSFLRRAARFGRADAAELEARIARLRDALPPTAVVEVEHDDTLYGLGCVVTAPVLRARVGAMLASAVRHLGDDGTRWHVRLIVTPEDGAAHSELALLHEQAGAVDELVRAHDALARLMPEASIEIDLEGGGGAWVRRIAREDALPRARELVAWWRDPAWPVLSAGRRSLLSLDVAGEAPHPDFIYAMSTREAGVPGAGSDDPVARRWLDSLVHLETVIEIAVPGAGVNLELVGDAVEVGAWDHASEQTASDVEDRVIAELRRRSPRVEVRRMVVG